MLAVKELAAHNMVASNQNIERSVGRSQSYMRQYIVERDDKFYFERTYTYLQKEIKKYSW